MWKSIIIITSLILALNTLNCLAAGLETKQKESFRERAERNIEKESYSSFNDMMTGLVISDDVSAGFLFGLDKEKVEAHEGPTDNSQGLGLGFGLNFSF